MPREVWHSTSQSLKTSFVVSFVIHVSNGRCRTQARKGPFSEIIVEGTGNETDDKHFTGVE